MGGLRCSFCNRGQQESWKFIAGPGAIYICAECVCLCNELLREQRSITTRAGRDDPACSFCNKNRRDVGALIVGPTIYICDQCTKLCVDLLAEDPGRPVDFPLGAGSPVERPSTREPERCAACDSPSNDLHERICEGYWRDARHVLDTGSPHGAFLGTTDRDVVPAPACAACGCRPSPGREIVYGVIGALCRECVTRQ